MNYRPYTEASWRTQEQIVFNAPDSYKVVSRDSYGNYTLEAMDGTQHTSCGNQTRTKFDSGQWATGEVIGGRLVITGSAPARGGD